MKVKTVLVVGALALLVSSAVAAGKQDKNESASQKVDSGSFGIFVNGRRMATESFSIQQTGNGSIAHSEFKTAEGGNDAIQTSELQLTSSGEIRRYEWKELSPGKAQAVVLPNDSFLIERSTMNAQEKQQEHPFLLPASTSILDDYFFIHREILAWKYLATSCRQQNGQLSCPVGQRAQFGALNPHSQTSMVASMEFSGKDKVAIRGIERELGRFNLKTDVGDWQLWLDDEFKLVRIVATDNTEVVRD